MYVVKRKKFDGQEHKARSQPSNQEYLLQNPVVIRNLNISAARI